ncbi:MAG TPA: hypothetical protein DD727_05460 [Clostridiales bacterium]|nr:hypothetical protein [Clostridiales bacterium]
MKKWLAGIVAGSALLLSVCSPVSAITEDPIAKAELSLESVIEKAILKGEKFEEMGFTTESPALQNTAENVVKKTEKIVDRLIEKAAEDGIEIVKYYEEVDIGGITVEVDPFHVF